MKSRRAEASGLPPLLRGIFAVLAQVYERHADECALAAEQAEDPKRRAMLLKLAAEWRRDAERLRQQAANGGDASAPAQSKGVHNGGARRVKR